MMLNISIIAMDRDSRVDDFIDEINIMPQFSGVVVSEPARSYIGTYSIVNMTFGYGFRCADNYFGSDCSIYCVDTDSDVDGHFLCDENGNKVCRHGYKDPSSSCIQQVQTVELSESHIGIQPFCVIEFCLK